MGSSMLDTWGGTPELNVSPCGLDVTINCNSIGPLNQLACKAYGAIGPLVLPESYSHPQSRASRGFFQPESLLDYGQCVPVRRVVGVRSGGCVDVYEGLFILGVSVVCHSPPKVLGRGSRVTEWPGTASRRLVLDFLPDLFEFVH